MKSKLCTCNIKCKHSDRKKNMNLENIVLSEIEDISVERRLNQEKLNFS